MKESWDVLGGKKHVEDINVLFKINERYGMYGKMERKCAKRKKVFFPVFVAHMKWKYVIQFRSSFSCFDFFKKIVDEI